MTSYRFCRPDDMHLLVKAANSCVIPDNSPEDLRFTADLYKTLAQEQDLWSSSCMVALEKDSFDVVAAILGCKRETETLLFGLGVRSDQELKTHLPDMIESLMKKFVILGPPTVVVEVLEEDKLVGELLVASGFRSESVYKDWRYQPRPDFDLDSGVNVAPLEEVTLDDIESVGLLRNTDGLAWMRQLRSLRNCKDALKGVAVVSSEALESYALYYQRGDVCEVLALGYNTNEIYLRALLRSFCYTKMQSNDQMSVHIPRISTAEIDSSLLESTGFTCTQRCQRYVQSITDYQASASSANSAACSSSQVR